MFWPRVLLAVVAVPVVFAVDVLVRNARRGVATGKGAIVAALSSPIFFTTLILIVAMTGYWSR
jgi:hypothetical protein